MSSHTETEAECSLCVKKERDARLRLMWNPEPGDAYHQYICPKHGDVAGMIYTHVEVDKTETQETFCFRCVMDHFKDSEIARMTTQDSLPEEPPDGARERRDA